MREYACGDDGKDEVGVGMTVMMSLGMSMTTRLAWGLV